MNLEIGEQTCKSQLVSVQTEEGTEMLEVQTVDMKPSDVPSILSLSAEWQLNEAPELFTIHFGHL